MLLILSGYLIWGVAEWFNNKEVSELNAYIKSLEEQKGGSFLNKISKLESEKVRNVSTAKRKRGRPRKK